MSKALTISVAAACKRYGIDRAAVSALLAQRVFPAFRLGRRILILRATADEYFANLKTSDKHTKEQMAFDF